MSPGGRATTQALTLSAMCLLAAASAGCSPRPLPFRSSSPCLPQATHSPSGPLTSGAGPLRPGPPALRVHAPGSLWHKQSLTGECLWVLPCRARRWGEAGAEPRLRSPPRRRVARASVSASPGPHGAAAFTVQCSQLSRGRRLTRGRLRTLRLPGGAGGPPPPTRSHSPGDFEACSSEAFFPCSPPPGSRRAQQPL